MSGLKSTQKDSCPKSQLFSVWHYLAVFFGKEEQQLQVEGHGHLLRHMLNTAKLDIPSASTV